MNRRVWLIVLLGVTPATASAQQLVWMPPKSYISGGFGAGQLTPSCDTGCFGDAMNANGIQLVAGWHIGPNLRIEVGAQRLQTTGVRSHASITWAGAAVYPTSRLFVRGGVGQVSMGIEDTVGVSEGKGAPGFMVGAGYDFPLSRSIVLTPYANVYLGSISSLEYQAGAGTTTTSGSFWGIHGGVSITFRPYRAENLPHRVGPSLPTWRTR